MLSLINPVINIINTLIAHKTGISQDVAAKELRNPLAGVTVTPMTYTYLGDMLDHCILIAESLDQIRKSADGMIGLINTIGADLNQSIKLLTGPRPSFCR